MNIFLDSMASPISYVSTNDVQKKWVLLLIKEFVENLKQMSGKCMDLGCGPGDITRNLLLPSLHPDATVIGKKIIHLGNNMYICASIYLLT